MALEELLKLVEFFMRVRGFERKEVSWTPDGGPLSYYEDGELGPESRRVVLVHGLGNYSVVWFKCMGPLAKEHWVQAVDLPGFGHSEPPAGRSYSTLNEMQAAVTALLESEEQKAVLVGQSLGGWVSTKIALDRPELVDQLVLINNAGVLYPQVHELRELLLAGSKDEIKAFWKRLWYRIPLLNSLFVGEFLERVEQPQIADFLDSLGPDDFLNDRLREIEVPTTILWGASDRFIPRFCVDIMLREMREARAIWIPKCGHIPQVERPKQVITCLQRLLAHPPSPPPPA